MKCSPRTVHTCEVTTKKCSPYPSHDHESTQKKVKSESPKSVLSVQRSYSLLSDRGDRDRGLGEELLPLDERLLGLEE